MKSISKRLGGQTLMENFSLQVNKGEIVSIVGESGSGKTTLVRMLNGLEKVDKGDILLNKQSLITKKTKKDALKNQVGLVFQDFQLFPHLTVKENCTLSPLLNKTLSKSHAKAKAEELLNKLRLSHKQDAYPKELSGGQKQRVAIARALMLEPEILCLDEPTSALDYETAKTFGNVLLSLLKEGLGIIMITHDLTFAEEFSDRIISSQVFLS